MENRDDCQTYVIHLREEHRRLHDVLKRIEAEWSIAPKRAAPETTAKTAQALRQLRDELAAHFREEDEGGCLDEAVSRIPDLGHAADRITGEHPSLLAELDEIIDRVQQMEHEAVAEQTVRDRYAEFATRLRRHEAAESRLLEKAFGAPVEY